MAGILAKKLEGCVRVRINWPIPLNEELVIQTGIQDSKLLHGETLIAQASSADQSRLQALLRPSMPPYVSFNEALEASKAYPGFESHPFPECFVCGPNREVGDGLRIFPGPHSSETFVCAPFKTYPSLFSSDKNMAVEYQWSALDCSGAYGIMNAFGPDKYVLGTIIGEIKAPIHMDEMIVAMGWAIDKAGRKARSGTALINHHGQLKSWALSTWIAIK